jgi:hypothetical protein
MSKKLYQGVLNCHHHFFFPLMVWDQACNIAILQFIEMVLQVLTNRENLAHFQTNLTRLEDFPSVRAELQTAAILSRSCAY